MKKHKIEIVVEKIAAERRRKSLSYENMADDLSITPAAYRKIETGETKLTVERLFRISDILKIPLTDLLEISNGVFNQNNHESAIGYHQKVENFYNENKEVYEKLLQSKDEQIALLKKRIE